MSNDIGYLQTEIIGGPINYFIKSMLRIYFIHAYYEKLIDDNYNLSTIEYR